MLLVGYAAALRRSELVALDVDDISENDSGLVVFIAWSKTDQAGLGDFFGIAHGHPRSRCSSTCPVRAWQEWRDALTAALGELPPASPAFRPITRHGRIGTPTDGGDPHARLTGQSVALIVKRAVGLLGDGTRFARPGTPGTAFALASRIGPHRLRSRWTALSARPDPAASSLRYICEADPCTNKPIGRVGPTKLAPKAAE